MWLEGLLRYSKSYIPSSSENVKLIPLKIGDTKNIQKYGNIVLTMYNNFQVWHYEKDMAVVRVVARRLRPLFVTIEDLLKTVIRDKGIEFSVIVFHTTPIGFVSYDLRPGTCLYILDVWIDPDYRGSGMFTRVHRILRRMATILHCKYLDLEVLVNNKDSYCKYVTIGYTPYIATYTRGISQFDPMPKSIIPTIFTKVSLNRSNLKLYEKDLIFLWDRYHEYKHLRFKLMGVEILNMVPWDIKNIIEERLSPEVTSMLFYLKDKPVGIITIMLSHTEGVAAAQINDFYFIEPYLENFTKEFLEYIHEYIRLNLPNVIYFSIFASLSDNIKMGAFENYSMTHRADNLYLYI